MEDVNYVSVYLKIKISNKNTYVFKDRQTLIKYITENEKFVLLPDVNIFVPLSNIKRILIKYPKLAFDDYLSPCHYKTFTVIINGNEKLEFENCSLIFRSNITFIETMFKPEKEETWIPNCNIRQIIIK